MNTYPTYQAAKIANPDKEIVTTAPDWDANKDCIGKFEPLSSYHWLDDDSGWTICNPADYCMTVKQFLDAGHKFVEGDLYIDDDGRVEKIGGEPSGENQPIKGDNNRYVLKAKALEETKTYRYEKVTDSIFDLKEEFERGELFSFDGDGHELQIETEGDFSYAHVHENLYRRIEVTERELEIEAMTARLWGRDIDRDVRKLAAKLHSLGFKLVNGKG